MLQIAQEIQAPHLEKTTINSNIHVFVCDRFKFRNFTSTLQVLKVETYLVSRMTYVPLFLVTLLIAFDFWKCPSLDDTSYGHSTVKILILFQPKSAYLQRKVELKERARDFSNNMLKSITQI